MVSGRSSPDARATGVPHPLLPPLLPLPLPLPLLLLPPLDELLEPPLLLPPLSMIPQADAHAPEAERFCSRQLTAAVAHVADVHFPVQLAREPPWEEQLQ